MRVVLNIHEIKNAKQRSFKILTISEANNFRKYDFLKLLS